MCLRAPSDTDSLSRSTESKSVARSARHKASRSRQKARQDQMSSSHSARQRHSGHPGTRQERAVSTTKESPPQTSAMNDSSVPSEPPSSPIKRGLHFIFNNFIPHFGTPSKFPTFIGAFSNDLSPFVQHPPKPPFADLVIDYSIGDGTESSYTGTGSSSSASTDSSSNSTSADANQPTVSHEQQESEDQTLQEGETPTTSDPILKWCKDVRKETKETKGNTAKIVKARELEEMEMQEEYEQQKRAWAEELLIEQEAREDRERLKMFGVEPRNRTSRTRASHSRFHPYSNSARRVHSSNSRHSSTGVAKTVDPLVALFAHYELQWERITDYSITTLTFATIPWPLLSAPRTVDDITPARIHDFMRFAKRGPDVMNPAQLRRAARIELIKWHPTSFTNVVLPLVVDNADAELVRTAVGIVHKALFDLMMAD